MVQQCNHSEDFCLKKSKQNEGTKLNNYLSCTLWKLRLVVHIHKQKSKQMIMDIIMVTYIWVFVANIKRLHYHKQWIRLVEAKMKFPSCSSFYFMRNTKQSCHVAMLSCNYFLSVTVKYNKQEIHTFTKLYIVIIDEVLIVWSLNMFNQK